MWLYHRLMSPNDADGMANSVDPDQTAPLGAVWSGSALFAQAYLSENVGLLRYVKNKRAATWQNQQNGMCARRSLRPAWASAYSDQSSLCALRIAKDLELLHADSEDADPTGRMPRLIWAFAGRKGHLSFCWFCREAAQTETHSYHSCRETD